jgi:hypothetical protein
VHGVASLATLHRLPGRFLLDDERGRSLGLTWHREAAVFVVSVWDGERCIGTVHLDPAQAGALTAALSNQLAEFLADAESARLNEVPEAIGL